MALRKIFLVSLLFLTATALAFGLYPIASHAVHSVNNGISSGSTPDGGYWHNPYTRFVPARYESGFAVAFDVGLSALCVSGLGWIATRRK